MNWITLVCLMMVAMGNLFGMTQMVDTVREGRLRNHWGDLWHYPLLMLTWTIAWFSLLSYTLTPR